MIPLPPKKARLSTYCMVLSVFTLLAYHLPFARHAARCLEGGFNSVLLVLLALVTLLGLNYLLYYLLVYCFRKVGKWIIAFTLVGNAIMLYGVITYDSLVTDEIMGSIFKSQYSEVSSFFSWGAVLYILLLGVLPSLYAIKRKVDYGSFKRFLGQVGISLAAIVAVVLMNVKNFTWIDRNSTELGSLIAPWSYIVNSFRFWASERQRNQKEILLPDVTSVSETRDICVLMIGESARQDHFSLYGYGKETNPLTTRDSVVALKADASSTYTLGGVKAILEPVEAKELYEILPNYLQRAGVDVSWRTSNWGEPPVHTEKYYKNTELKNKYPDLDGEHDGILLAGLKEELLESQADKIFVVIHGYTNHGPAYYSNYPPEFEVFTPACHTVEMSKTTQEELFNAYDNSVLYTDYLIHSVIEMLKDIPDRRSCVFFVSDHGESLGENNLYMHGIPYSMAPKEQIEIPFLVWAPDMQVKPLEKVGQHHVFHSVLRFFGMESPAFDEEKCIFAKN